MLFWLDKLQWRLVKNGKWDTPQPTSVNPQSRGWLPPPQSQCCPCRTQKGEDGDQSRISCLCLLLTLPSLSVSHPVSPNEHHSPVGGRAGHEYNSGSKVGWFYVYIWYSDAPQQWRQLVAVQALVHLSIFKLCT